MTTDADRWYGACSRKLDRLEAGVDRGDSIDAVLAAWCEFCETALPAGEPATHQCNFAYVNAVPLAQIVYALVATYGRPIVRERILGGR